MSNKILSAVFEHSKTRYGARLVMLALADRAHDDGKCWCGIGDLMRRSGLSRDAVFRAINDAVELGELVRDQFGGMNRCNAYTVLNQDRLNIRPSQIKTATVLYQDSDRLNIRPKPSLTHKNHIDHSANDLHRPKKASKPTAPGFDEFWKAFPRKVGKKDALKAWGASKELPPVADILAAIERQKTSEQWRDPRFIPHPATWIRGARWTDELPTESKPTSILPRL